MENYEWDKTITPCNPHPMEAEEYVGYQDYTGSINIESDITTLTPELHETLGLDRERWSIVGLYVSPASGKSLELKRDREDLIIVYCVDNALLSDEDKKVGGLTQSDAPLDVVSFYCHDMKLADILRSFKSVHLNFKRTGVSHRNFVVRGRADIPVQDD